MIRFNMPRTDLHVTVAGTEVKPCLALGAWAAFHHLSANDSTVIDDLVLTVDEVAPVMKALQQGGAEVTALHNHPLPAKIAETLSPSEISVEGGEVSGR